MAELKKYLIQGVEEVYDAFDEWEHDLPQKDILVTAASLEEAVSLGRETFQRTIDDSRRESGHITSPLSSGCGPSGMYSAHVEKVLDLDGKVLYQDIRKRII